jgi:hypothetical protein
MLAAGRNMLAAVFRLIELGAPLDDANKHGHNPLIWASICGHSEVIKALLLRGANINHKTAEGRTALHYACLYSKAKAADTLLNFLFEKFQTFRLDHPKKKPDPTRWSKYCTILENFLNVKDQFGKKPYDLISHQIPETELYKTYLPSVYSNNGSHKSESLFNQSQLKDYELRDDLLPPPPLGIHDDRIKNEKAKSKMPAADIDEFSQVSFGYQPSISVIEQDGDKKLENEQNEISVYDGDSQNANLSLSVESVDKNIKFPFSTSIMTVDTDSILGGMHGINDAHSLLSVMTGTADTLSLEEVFRKTNVKKSLS